MKSGAMIFTLMIRMQLLVRKPALLGGGQLVRLFPGCQRRINIGDLITLLVLKHSGLYSITDDIPDHDLSVIIRILPKLAFYEGRLKNGIKSRKWDNHEGFSVKIECCIPLEVGIFP
jgi:hypothetical protein